MEQDGPEATYPGSLPGATRSGLGTLRSAALEALHPAARIDQLLLAGVERVALGAQFDMKVGLGRARVELVST